MSFISNLTYNTICRNLCDWYITVFRISMSRGYLPQSENVPSKAQSENGSRGYPPSTSRDTINRESMLVHLVIWQLSLFTFLLYNWQLLYRCLFYQVALLCLMLIMVLLVMYILMVSRVNSIEVFLFSYQQMLLHLLRSIVSL
jgi:small-conductance mechanosensitive channel